MKDRRNLYILVDGFADGKCGESFQVATFFAWKDSPEHNLLKQMILPGSLISTYFDYEFLDMRDKSYADVLTESYEYRCDDDDNISWIMRLAIWKNKCVASASVLEPYYKRIAFAMFIFFLLVFAIVVMLLWSAMRQK